jgi:serine/threonine protein kinase
MVVIKQCVKPKYRHLIVNEIIAHNHIRRHVPVCKWKHFIFYDQCELNSFIDINNWHELPYITYRYVEPDKQIKHFDVVRQLVDIVKALHSVGLKHNDIKPQNIIISNKVVKLIDFGLSTIKQQTIKYRGTTGYIPLNKSVVVCCKRQDVYGVIATMFFYLFGTCPFTS